MVSLNNEIQKFRVKERYFQVQLFETMNYFVTSPIYAGRLEERSLADKLKHGVGMNQFGYSFEIAIDPHYMQLPYQRFDFSALTGRRK